MSKRVFFSFHYEDVISFRANVVRKHDLLKETGSAGYFDASIWEDAKLHGDNAVKRLINSGLENTSVTCVLIGTGTWSRRWVRYEILKSYERGNTLLGIHINSIPDKNRQTFIKGANPFNYLGFFINSLGSVDYYQELNEGKWQRYTDLLSTKRNYKREAWDKGHTLSNWVRCYDWVTDNGYYNFASWINDAK